MTGVEDYKYVRDQKVALYYSILVGIFSLRVAKDFKTAVVVTE